MTTVPIDLTATPSARLIFNHLVTPATVDDLDSDLVLVELPGEIFLDVSWCPANQTPGCYLVTVYRRDQWDSPLGTAEAMTAEEAARLVGRLASEHSQTRRPIPITS